MLAHILCAGHEEGDADAIDEHGIAAESLLGLGDGGVAAGKRTRGNTCRGNRRILGEDHTCAGDVPILSTN